MSLTLALNNALSGLKVNQRALSTISQNIANANTPGYSRQVVNLSPQIVGSQGAGVKVDSITRKVDDYLERAVRNTTSDVARYNVIKDSLDKAQILFGIPDTGTSLDERVAEFFDAVKAIADTPERSSLRYNAVNAGVQLAQNISDIAYSFQELRYQADKDIDNAVEEANEELRNLFNVNLAINNAQALGNNISELLDKRDQHLEALANIMDVKVYFKETGEVSVFTGNGIGLVDENLHQITYSAASSINAFINEDAMQAIEVYTIGSYGQPTGSPQVIATAGRAGEVTTVLNGGKLKGLLELRDTELKAVLDQLDNFSANFRDTFNALHNDGSGYPAATTLTGTRLVSPGEIREWSGAVRIAVLNKDGSPADPYYQNEAAGLRPLTLDLSALDVGLGAGRADAQTIIDEINRYFGNGQPKATVGNMNNIQLAAVSDNIPDTAGVFNFNFELENISDLPSTFSVTSINITGDVNGAYGAVVPPANSTTVAPGGRMRSGNFNYPGPLLATDNVYTVTAVVTVNDGVNPPYNATISYDVPNNLGANNLRNDRFAASAIAGPDGVITLSDRPTVRMVAELVDENGNTIPQVNGEYINQPGYIRLRTTSSDYMIAMDELTSSERGYTSGGTVFEATNRGFSHYFELNNFFTSNNNQRLNSALNLQVRDDIIANPNLITTGELVRSAQPSTGTPASYTYETGAGNNVAALRLSALQLQLQQFESAGGLPTVNLTLGEYLGEILGYNAAKSNGADNNLERSQLLLDGFATRADSISGVNMDEELGNIILYQNAYTASARVISVTDELFETLLNSF
jgi:flagellar hook-associated protein 1 FlgK